MAEMETVTLSAALAGVNSGTITASYATGSADGGDGDNDYAGGLVGLNSGGGTITASYATGSADGGDGDDDFAGGLVGVNYGTHHRQSMPPPPPMAGDGGSDDVGGLAGLKQRRHHHRQLCLWGGNRRSWWLRRHTSQWCNSCPSGLRASNAGASWNNGAWNFGTTSQLPALVYADYDGSGNAHSCDNYPDKIPGTTITLALWR